MTRRDTRRLGRCLLALACGGGLALGLDACNTPFIPIPPPGDPTFTPVMVAQGTGQPVTMWQTSGTPSAAMADARVHVYNLDARAGVIVRAEADGSYVAAPIDGRAEDRVELYYAKPSGERSPIICRLLRPGPDPARTPCP